ncbi:MAG: hypothetical protein GWN51_05850, partial [Gemmatimonadetes bacterium]|nr:hypothetical protein [Actinomycetota bacterium]NIV23166.1 hypothetical protein [Gemmatimonadota bacterium]
MTDPVNVTFDASAERLLIFDAPAGQMIEIPAGPDGALDPEAVRRIDVRSLGVREPRGLAVDPVGGRLFVLDAAYPRIVRAEAGGDGGFERPAVADIDLPPTGLNLRGLAFDPSTGHLHVLDAATRVLHELTESGRVVASRDLSGLRIRRPEGLTFAPSADATDDPDEMSLYVADSGERRADGRRGDERVDAGQILEISFVEPGIAAASTASSSLVSIIDVSRFSPPSPDPAGITYLGHLGDLLISDSEVNEMSIYQGANLFRTTLQGSLVETYTTLAYSNEPTGITWNPRNNHVFISDDNADEIFELAPGPDGQYGT